MEKVAPLLAKLLTGPFGGSIEMAARKLWLSLQEHLALVQFTNLYLGGAYIAAGENPFLQLRKIFAKFVLAGKSETRDSAKPS